MNNNTLKQCAVIVFAVLLWFSPSWLIAQNLIVNGDFESYSIYGEITAPSYTDYIQVEGPYGVEAGHYVIDNTTDNHGGGQGWPMPSDSHGKFMIVNGYGGDNNPSMVVWRQTVNVTAQTNYTFSYRYVNLNWNFQIIPAKLQVKINGTNFGSVNSLPSNNNWHNWNNNGTKWNSGNATQAVIEIYDTYTGLPGYGDDFCLDDISFVPDVVYSITANPDNASACLNTPTNVYVLGNDIIQPNIQDVTLQVVTDPQHGMCFVNNAEHYIQYIYTGGGTGTDQFKYRATNHGVTSEAWVYVTTSTPPTVGNITAPGPICANGALGIPTPSVNPSAPGQWEYSSSQTGPFQTFDPNNVPQSMNGKWVRYTAINDCGEGHSNAVQITVTNGPSFSGQTPQIQPICAGGNLNLTPPTYNANGSQILSYGWVASQTENGTYTTFNSNSLNNIPASYNGWYIRYMIEGSCGYVYSNPARLLTVNVAPEVTGTLQAPPAICAGGDLNVTAPTYDGNGTGSWEICQTPTGSFQPFSILYVPATYNNWYLHYKVSNDCGSDVSNAVQIHVNDAPTIATPATPQAICAGNSFNLTTPSIQNHGATITDQGWQIAAAQNGTYSAFNNNNVPYAYNGYWIRYFAENECGETHSASVQITVNDEPIVGNIIPPAGICAGQSFNLTTPQVTWRHINQGTGSWEIAPTSTGQFTPLTNNNIPYSYNGYYIRYKAVNGCGTSYSTNVVQVTVYSTEPIDEGEITACDVIYHHGVQCNQTGPYTGDTIINGCTVSVSWYFILGDEFIAMPEEIQECDSYYWSRTHRTYYETGIYDTTIVSGNPMICDSTFTLNLTINHAPVITEQLESPNPIEVCSSIGVLNVTAPSFENGGTTGWEYATSEYGPWNNEFNPASFNLDFGSYWLRFVVDNDCADQPVYSNPVPFYVSEAPVISIVSGQMPESVCEGSPLDLPDIVVDWKNMNQSGIVSRWEISENGNSNSWFELPDLAMPIEHDWWIRYYAQNSCDGAILGPVRVSAIEVEDETVDYEPECDSIMCIYDEVYYYESTVIDEVIDYPCPHIRHHNLVVNHSDRPETNPELIEVIVWCKDEYVWHDRTYYRSEQLQVDRWSTTNVWGCDSIRELRLSFGDANEIYFNNQHGCDSYIWEVNDTISVPYSYDENEPHVLDTVFVPGVGEACDTYYYLDLVMGKNWEEWESPQDTIPLCNGEEWNGTPYYESQSVTETLTASTGCDSIVSRYLSVTQPFIERDTIVNCQLPYLWFSQGESHLFNEDGEEYTATLTSSETSCDSIVTIHFKLADNIEKNDSASVCEPFMLPDGQTVNHGGLWSYIIPSFDSCDTTVYLNVAFIQTDTLTAEPLYACNTITFNGITYGPGFHSIYYDTVIMPNGCISSVRLQNLTVKDSEQMGTISGLSNVYVASSLISGVYRYEIDLEGLNGPVTWSLSNLNWRILETGNDFCRVLVTTPGTALLTAHFNVEECGEMERSFEIVAGFFGVEDIQNEVRIFPNPTKGTVTIEAEGIESLRLINMMGQVLEIWEYDRSDSAVLNLNGYTPAVFLLEIKTVYGVAKKRLILCR